MSLDVDFYNTFFNEPEGANAFYKKNQENEMGPYSQKQSGVAAAPVPISLAQNDTLEITVKYGNRGERNFQIGLMAKSDNDSPTVTITCSEKTWTLKNVGNNTGVQVGAGPDGQ